jgi:hypothetical protein
MENPGQYRTACVKGKLSDYNYESLEDVLDAMTGVDEEALTSVFESWVGQLKWVIKQEGKYYTKPRKNKRHVFKIGQLLFLMARDDHEDRGGREKRVLEGEGAVTWLGRRGRGRVARDPVNYEE